MKTKPKTVKVSLTVEERRLIVQALGDFEESKGWLLDDTCWTDEDLADITEEIKQARLLRLRFLTVGLS